MVLFHFAIFQFLEVWRLVVSRTYLKFTVVARLWSCILADVLCQPTPTGFTCLHINGKRVAGTGSLIKANLCGSASKLSESPQCNLGVCIRHAISLKRPTKQEFSRHEMATDVTSPQVPELVPQGRPQVSTRPFFFSQNQYQMEIGL
jgi:hypothetical protein